MRTASKSWYLLLTYSAAVLYGCGGGNSTPQQIPATPPPPVTTADFQLSAVPQVAISPGGAVDIQVTVSPSGGFQGTVQIAPSGLPPGVSGLPIPVSVVGSSPTSGMLHLNAAPSAPVGQATVNLLGTSGALSHTIKAQLSVTSAGAIRPFITLGGVPFQAFVDTTRQLLFVTNPGLNEVDVLSSTTFVVIRRVPVTEPMGIDQMSDGNTLVIGTNNETFYTLDENTFVTSRHLVPYDLSWAFHLENLFWFPNALPNGKVLFVTSNADLGNSCNNDYGGNGLYTWDSVSDSITQTPTPGQFHIYDAFAHSGDHRFALIESCGELQLFDSSSGQFKVVPDTYAAMVAANNDGSQYAVLDGQITFFDSKMQQTGQLPTPNLFYISSTLMYNQDGSRLYVEGSIGYGNSPMLVVIDPKAQKLLGYLSMWYGGNPGVLLAAGSGSDIFVGGYGGIGYINTSTTYPSTNSGFASGAISPDSVPLNTQVTATMPAGSFPFGTVATVNGLPALVTNTNSLTMTVPASASAGPANIVVTEPSGATFVFPDQFAYGLSLEGLSATLLPDSTATWLNLYAYGLLPGGNPAAVSVAGSPVQSKVPNGYIVSGALEFQFVSAPPQPPSTVDVSVSNPNGSATSLGALTYLHDKILPTAQPPSGVYFDNQRNVAYVIDGSRIDVLDANTLQWLSPITIPNAPPSLQLAHLAQDSSGNILALDRANVMLYRIYPANPSSAVAIPLTVYNLPKSPPVGGAPLSPYKVFPLPNQQALVTMVNWFTAIVDLNTKTLTYGGQIGHVDLYPLPNGTDVLGAVAGSQSTVLFTWNLPTNSVHELICGEASSEILEASHDGSLLATTGTYNYGVGWGSPEKTVLLDTSLHKLRTVAFPQLAFPLSNPLFTLRFSPQDKVLVIVRTNEVDFVDVATGSLLQRFATPEPLYMPPYAFVFGAAAALDSTGTKLFLTSSSGITVVQFPTTIDSMQMYKWRFQSRHPLAPGAQSPLVTHYVRAYPKRGKPE